MKEIRKKIKDALAGAKCPALLCSFGKDSLLLLFLALQVRPDISIIWFKQRASEAQKRFAEKIILDWNLTVLSYSPADSYFLPNEESLTLIDEMSFGNTYLPLLTDTTTGSTCAVKLKGERTPFFGYGFDVTLFGYKRTDNHPIIRTPFNREFAIGDTHFVAPLWDLTDEQILQAIKDNEILYEEIDDSIPVCTRCLKSSEPVFCPEVKGFISPVVWDKQARLAEFQARFI